jgi:hypothetical protein
MREEDPKSFQAAVDFEKRFQTAYAATRTKGIPYLHRSCQPLEEVDFSTEDSRTGQLNMFENECEGMCGV